MSKDTFLNYAMSELTSDKGWKYKELFRIFISRVRYYENHPELFLPKLKAKLEIAAKEYGDPKESKKKYDIQAEIDMEILDGVAGWALVGRYLKDK